MHKSLIALAFLAGTAISPAFAQLGGVGVGGTATGNIGAGSIGAGSAGDIGGSVSGTGANVGTSATGAVNSPAGSIGAGASGNVNASTNAAGAATGTLSASERTAQAAAMGIDLKAKRAEGYIGRTVIGADGKALGTVRSVNTSSDLQSVTSVAVGNSSASAVAIDAAKLSTNASGQLVASGISKADLSGLPAADASSSASLIGQTVVGSDGAALGTVQNVVVNESGSISQVLLKAKGSGKLVAMDRTQLSASKGGLSASQVSSTQFKALAE